MVQQHSGSNLANDFWQVQMRKHPNLYGILSTIGAVANFFLNGHFIVALGRWLIRVSGDISETSLLFAVLWITSTSVAPDLIKLFMSEQLMQRLLWFAFVVLALIPEIILANAIVNAISHWIVVARHQRSVIAWTWAILFTIPTILFFVLTAITLNTLGANGGNIVKASTDTLNLRLDAGWIYGLLELTYAGVKKFMPQYAHNSVVPSPTLPIVPTPEALAQQLMPLFMEQLNGLKATLVTEMKPLFPVAAPVSEPVDYEKLFAHLAPRLAPEPVNYHLLAQHIAPLLVPEPVTIDYQEVASAIAPLLKPSFVEARRTIIEEVKAIVPQIAVQTPIAIPQIEAKTFSAQQHQTEQVEAVETENDAERDVRLEAALAKLIVDGKKVSGRALSEEAHCNRKAATHWLQKTHPEYSIVKVVTQSQDDQERLLERVMAPEPENERADVEPEPVVDVEAGVPDVAPEPRVGISDVASHGEIEATDRDQQPEPTTEERAVVPAEVEPENSIA